MLIFFEYFDFYWFLFIKFIPIPYNIKYILQEKINSQNVKMDLKIQILFRIIFQLKFNKKT